MEVNTEAWSVGKYAKRSAIIHMNSEAAKHVTRLVLGAGTAVNADQDGDADGRLTLNPAPPAGLRLTDYIKIVVSNGAGVVTNSEYRDLVLISGADVDISLVISQLTNANFTNANFTATYELFRREFPSSETSVKFSTTTPNYIGYPEHKRCLVPVQHVAVFPTDIDDSGDIDLPLLVRPLMLGVELDGVPVEKVLRTRIDLV